jgi:hypothetical protein
MSFDARVAFSVKALADFVNRLSLFRELEGSGDDTDALHTCDLGAAPRSGINLC